MIVMALAGVIPVLLCGFVALGIWLTYAEYRAAKERARRARGISRAQLLRELEPGLIALFWGSYDEYIKEKGETSK